MKIIHDESNVRVYVKYDALIIQALKSIGSGWWIPKEKAWVFPVEKLGHLLDLNKEILDNISLSVKKAKDIEISKSMLTSKEISDIQGHGNALSDRLKLKGYSPKTIKSYKGHLLRFLEFSHLKWDKDHINAYLLFLLDEKQCSHSYVNQAINSIKHHLLAQGCNKKTDYVSILRPKKESVLPKVLSKDEVRGIISNTINLKHRLALMMAYSCGMRVSEVAELLLVHVDYSRKTILIRQGKGRKDRLLPLSDTLRDELKLYIQNYKPHKFVFENPTRDGHITARTFQKIFKQACKRAKITKNSSFHSLRHSYATHLLESGVQLRYIQELLGHASSKTTERYTHVSNKEIKNIRNPLDDLGL